MNKLHPVNIYNDEKLEWNELMSTYQLTFKFAKEFYDENFIDDNTLKKRIKKNSSLVYRFIYSRVNQRNLPIVKKILSNTEEGRNFIFDLLKTQFEADVDSGYNDLADTPAINFANGQVLPREEINRNAVSVATEQVWDNNATYFGFNIGYQTQFPPYYFIYLGRL